ncbi:MAG: IS21 family transposase [Methyloprofundus sp.]|nr:IS21 family transposase [Methyloprofundus sp.]
MTISKEKEADILRYHHVEKWPVGTISKQLGIHHDAVNRVLSQAGIPKTERTYRSSMIDPYLPFVNKTLEQFPNLCSSRLYSMVKERGYPGGPDHFRHLVAERRPRKIPEAFLRLKTLPGEQAQIDWGHFGHLTVGQAKRPLMAFVMVLSWSRQIFLRFYLNQQMSNFLRGHEAAFECWQGLPKVLLYDNLKSAVLERQGDAIRFNPQLLEFASHYHFEPRPVAVYRGNEKGRVERAIRYVRDNFFAARAFNDLDDLNAQADRWCQGQSADRLCPEDKTMTVREAFAKERPSLLTLPDNRWPTDERVEVKVGKTPYVRFDKNDYSIPHTQVRKVLTVTATLKQVRVLEGQNEIAIHSRSFDKGEQIENPEHIDALIERKRKGRQHRGQDRLIQAVPSCSQLLNEAALRGDNLGSITSTLLRLLDQYGAGEVDIAVQEALKKEVPHPNAVRQTLQKRREERLEPPPLAVSLPDDKRVRNLNIKPHALIDYDLLKTPNETKPEKNQPADEDCPVDPKTGEKKT